MYQVIPFHWLVIAIVWMTISVLALSVGAVDFLHLHHYFHYAILAVDLGLLLLTWKPVWIFVWHALGLNSWFPDLNGQYDVELRHNWPIQERLLEAATSQKKFDPRSEASRPDLATTKLRASIDAGFYRVDVDMWSEDQDDPNSVINHSRALVSVLRRPCDGQPHRLVYVYQQKNRRDHQASTDDSIFEGAAILDLRAGASEFVGDYWTNRAWHQGLSTAGLIKFVKRS